MCTRFQISKYPSSHLQFASCYLDYSAEFVPMAEEAMFKDLTKRVQLSSSTWRSRRSSRRRGRRKKRRRRRPTKARKAGRRRARRVKPRRHKHLKQMSPLALPLRPQPRPLLPLLLLELVVPVLACARAILEQGQPTQYRLA